MNTNAYHYKFAPSVPMDEVEDMLILSTIVVKYLFGCTQLQLNGAFRLNKKSRSCIVDGQNDAGHSVIWIFTSFLIRRFGKNKFKIKKIADKATNNTKNGNGKKL